MDRLKLVIYTHDVQVHGSIADRFPEVVCRIEDTVEGMLDAVVDADIVFMARAYTREMVRGAPSLKWLHLGGAGVDRLRPFHELPSQITVTYTPSLNAAMMADYVMSVISMLVWNFPQIIRNQQCQRWQRWAVERLEGKIIVLIGLGNVGTAVAERARVAGMSLIGVRRNPQFHPDFEQVVGPQDLLKVLPRADFVTICAPLTSATEGLLGERELHAMKESAFLINVGRGAIINETTLIAALEEGQIAGAALDVFSDEPLPVENRLWHLPNVIITPHISALSTDYHIRASELFCTNLEKYLAGESLPNTVNLSREY